MLAGTSTSSMATIRSAARMPSRYAGVPSSGEMTMSCPSRMSKLMPIPE
jgi:hypothetical protein